MEKAEVLCMVCVASFNLEDAELIQPRTDSKYMWVRCPKCRTQIILPFESMDDIRQFLREREGSPK